MFALMPRRAIKLINVIKLVKTLMVVCPERVRPKGRERGKTSAGGLDAGELACHAG